MLLEGRGTEIQPEEGRVWLGKAAEAGMIDAQLAYARLLVEGIGGPEDHSGALAMYIRAAEAGSVPAMFSLGAMYGGGHEVEKDTSLARKWFAAAAEAGHPVAQLMMARYCAQGIAGEVDREAALIWYRKSEAQGIVQASAELSQLDLLPELSFEEEDEAVTLS